MPRGGATEHSGHRAGDELLRWVGEQLSAAVRPTDSVARLGGAEFAVLLPDTDRVAAEPLIRRLREALGSRIPCCVGCATAPEDGLSFDDLYRVGDSALYQHKLGSSGRPFSVETILAGLPEALFVLDEQGRFAYGNPAAGRLFGRDAHELLGQSLEFLAPELAGSALVGACRRVLNGGRPERFVESLEPGDAGLAVSADPVPGGVSVRVSPLDERLGAVSTPLLRASVTGVASRLAPSFRTL